LTRKIVVHPTKTGGDAASRYPAERPSDGTYMGQIGLLHWDDVDAREDVEVAYMLLPQFWGHGYATEAAQACRDWAFLNLGVDRVVSFIAVENQPSIAVAERNGMVRAKRLDENRFYRPIYVYCIKKDEWARLSGFSAASTNPVSISQEPFIE
jgi:RimJ/RimL family protein N-acetyltransferase